MKCLLGIAVVFFLSTAQAQTYIQLVLDLSGSMYEKLESGEPKIDAARLVLTDFISSLPHDNLNVGLRVYGATTGAMDAGACEDSQLAVGMQGVDKDTLLGIVSTTNPKGATPIAYSLQQAVADFQGISAEAEKIIVLVTDGEESCGGDAERVAS
jgi:Ca-activated chloride channel homolog